MLLMHRLIGLLRALTPKLIIQPRHNTVLKTCSTTPTFRLLLLLATYGIII